MAGLQAVGQLLPVLTTTLGAAQTVYSAVNTIQDLTQSSRSEDLALSQLREQQALQAQQLAQQSSLKQQEVALNSAQAEEDRLSALRRAVASQRASFGASGVGSGHGGSSEAVLLGLFEESEDERSQREKSDALKRQALDQRQTQSKSLNLLQATQLAEKQSLNNLF